MNSSSIRSLRVLAARIRRMDAKVLELERKYVIDMMAKKKKNLKEGD